MFDLEKQIVGWRRQMRASGLKSPEALDELEGHLREELARQQKLGLSASAAFEAAIQQMGQTGAVAGEFGKTARAPKASPGVMVGICAVLVASIVWLSGFTLNQMNVSIGGQIQAYAAVLLSLAIACGWRYAVPFLPVVANPWKRAVVAGGCVLAGILICSFYLNVILPRFEPSAEGMEPAEVFWALLPLALFTCLGLALLMDQKAREDLGMDKFKGISKAA
jgi:hypothetical protein